MSYKHSQYSRVETLIKENHVFNDEKGGGVFRGKHYPFILQNRYNNLVFQSRHAICDYFDKNNITWWNGRLTNHPLSSQVACLNHLFPIREDKQAVLSLIHKVNPEIMDVLPIKSDSIMQAYIQFESVSDADHLNELSSTRGSNCTSIDALIWGIHRDGRKFLFPIEWKYVEAYGNDNKASGEKGKTRKARYTELINQSSQLNANYFNVYYFEPFYQLMRQTLWVEQMIIHKQTESIEADDYIHLHVIPDENYELLHKIFPCSNQGMEDTWRACLKNQEKYVIISPCELLAPVLEHEYEPLFTYLQKRYW